MNSSWLCSPAVSLEALGSWEPVHSCPYPATAGRWGSKNTAWLHQPDSSLTLAMEGENLGDSALETWPGKVTKIRNSKARWQTPTQRGTQRKEGGTQGRLRDCGTGWGRALDENKKAGRVRNTVTSTVQKGPERASTQPLFRQNSFCAVP